MTLQGCFIDVSKPPPAWVALWRTANGNAIHDRLQMNVAGTSEADAWIFALDHYPEWSKR